MSTYLLNLLACPCPCPSVPPRIIATLLFQACTISWGMLLIDLYEGVMFVRMTWYKDEYSDVCTVPNRVRHNNLCVTLYLSFFLLLLLLIVIYDDVGTDMVSTFRSEYCTLGVIPSSKDNDYTIIHNSSSIR